MIKCKEAVERLWAYLDKRLEGQQAKEVDEHLVVCRHCCGELEFAQQIRAKLAHTPETEMPAETRARVEQLLKGLGS